MSNVFTIGVHRLYTALEFTATAFNFLKNCLSLDNTYASLQITISKLEFESTTLGFTSPALD